MREEGKVREGAKTNYNEGLLSFSTHYRYLHVAFPWKMVDSFECLLTYPYMYYMMYM